MDTVIGAVVGDGDGDVVVVLVGSTYMQPDNRDALRTGLSLRLGGVETVLAAKRDTGALEFYGRSDVVQRLCEADPRSLLWKELTLTKHGVGRTL